MINVFAREGAKVIISDISAREKDGLEGVKEINEKYGAVGKERGTVLGDSFRRGRTLNF